MHPPIIFNLDKELDKKVCLDFLNVRAGGVDFGQGIIKMYPQPKTAAVKAQRMHQKIISSLVDRYYQTHQREMRAALTKTRSDWEKIDQKFAKRSKLSLNITPGLPGSILLIFQSLTSIRDF